jgi:predicted dehydrogenase
MNETHYTRRNLLVRAGQGLFAAGLVGGTGGTLSAAQAQQGGALNKPMEPPTPQKEPALPVDKRVGWAICGLGDFATQQIMPAFSDCRKSKLTAFITGDLAKGQKLAEQYGIDPKNVYTYQNFASIKENAAVDVVYVITPNALHKDHVLLAAAAGKHVMCEKPMATNPEDCQAMIDACRKADRKLMIAYRAQYEPFNLEAMRLCRSGELGRIVTITADHGRQIEPEKPADSWRVKKALSGGGSLVDIGVYSLQAARYLTGEEPIEVSARMESPKDDPRFKEVEATVHWTLHFPSGALANCSSSYDWLDTKRYRVQGAKGWLELDPATDYYRHRLRIGRKGKGEETVVEEPQIQEQSQFALEVDHLSTCILENKMPRTPGEEGLRDVRYMQAIYEAARTGRVIKL